MFEIRPSSLNDSEEVYFLINELEGTELDKDKFERVYALNLSNPAASYYVAIDSGDIIGFVSLHIQELLHHTAKIAEIQELVVKSAYRGKGIGEKLFEQAKHEAQLKNCAQLEVACNQKRTKSHGFYVSRGMTNSHFKFCMSLE